MTLSLSLALQHAVAEAIGDRTACGVALDVRTGEVLAAYSNPVLRSQPLTVPITAGRSGTLWSTIRTSRSSTAIVQATYPPASLYKPVTSLAGL